MEIIAIVLPAISLLLLVILVLKTQKIDTNPIIELAR
jgi:hypothetical protein